MSKTIIQLAANSTLQDTDLFEKSLNGAGSRKMAGSELRAALLSPAVIGGTAGTVPMFAMATPFLANSPMIVAAGFVGIGTLAPATPFHVATSITTSPRGIMSSQHNDGTDGAGLHLRKSRGTNAAPTTVVSGDNLGRIVATGYDGASYLEMGSIIIGTRGTIGANRIPTNMSFWVATDASPSVLTQKVTITSVGVGIGTDNPIEDLHLYSNVSHGLRIETVGVNSRSYIDLDHQPGGDAQLGWLLGASDFNHIALRDTSAKDLGIFLGDGTGSPSERMRIVNTTGNVGIGTTSPGSRIHSLLSDAVTNAISVVSTVEHSSSGTPAANFGVGILFNLQSSTTAGRNAGQLSSIWTTATDASRTSALLLSTVNNAGALTEGLRVDGVGDITVAGFVLWSGHKRVSTQFDKTSDVTLANVTGLSVSLLASRNYAFEAVLYTTSNVAGGVQFAIAGTATATAIIYEATVESAGGIVAETRATALATAVGGITAVTAAYCRITGTIAVNAAGTLTVQFAQNASNGSASSVLVGSTFKVHELV